MSDKFKNYTVRMHHKHNEIKIVEIYRNTTCLLSYDLINEKPVDYITGNQSLDSVVLNGFLRGSKWGTFYNREQKRVFLIEKGTKEIIEQIDEEMDIKRTQNFEVKYKTFKKKGLAVYEAKINEKDKKT